MNLGLLATLSSNSNVIKNSPPQNFNIGISGVFIKFQLLLFNYILFLSFLLLLRQATKTNWLILTAFQPV